MYAISDELKYFRKFPKSFSEKFSKKLQFAKK